MCTYEKCAEGDQQYDSLKDWVDHEVNTHRNIKLRLAPNDIYRQRCPICLEKNPTIVHIGVHLRRFAIFALPNSAESDEDTRLRDQSLEIPEMNEWDPMPDIDVSTIGNALENYAISRRHAQRQVDKPTEAGLDVNSFGARLKPENVFSYQRESNNSRSASAVLDSGVMSFYARIDTLVPNYQAHLTRRAPYNSIQWDWGLVSPCWDAARPILIAANALKL